MKKWERPGLGEFALQDSYGWSLIGQGLRGEVSAGSQCQGGCEGS